MKKYQLVLVKWVDIVSHSGWKTDEDFKQEKLAKVITVGFVIKKTKKVLKLGFGIEHGVNNEGYTLNQQIIPMGCILKIKKLKRYDKLLKKADFPDKEVCSGS